MSESEHGNNFSLLHSTGRPNGLVKGNGTLTAKHSAETSEGGFGTLTPENPVHRQTGDMRKRKVVRAMLGDQSFKCYLTGVNLTPETAALDHIIPVSKGGHPTDARNGGFLHSVVNKMKGSMDLDEFMQWCGRVAGGAADVK